MFSWQLSNDTPTAFVNIGKLNVVAGDVTAASLILIMRGFSVVVIFLRLSSAARSVCLASRTVFVSFARALIANTVNTTPTASNAQIINATDSLKNKSSRPHTPHPNAHTPEETAQIAEVFKSHPDISYAEALGILRTDYGYARTYGGFYRFLMKHKIRPVREINPYIAKPYDTPEMFGVKMQMDVKYVPLECNVGEYKHERYYQYTMIDEATRERFIYPYKEKSGYSTVDFIKRAIIYFGYLPAIIQTDNGTEFTNPKGTGEGKVHAVDQLLNRLRIKHKLIRVYTPRHNGKVERSHRTDQENFYNHLTFSTFEELREKMHAWLVRYNHCPHSSLRDKYGRRSWITPLQKRAELMDVLKSATPDAGYRVKFLKKKAA